MELYTNPMSQNCRKVLMTAEFLGIPLRHVMVDLMASEQRKPDFLELNPNGKVPVLADGSLKLWESNAIMQYLAGKRPASTLWPASDLLRADISRWQFWEAAHWFPACMPFMWENMAKGWLNLGAPDLQVLEQATAKFEPVVNVLEQHLGGRQYLVGNSLTLADISVGSHLTYADPAKLPIQDKTNLRKWLERLESTDMWQKTATPMAA